jgi:PAS domain S-box-containing protein
MREAPLALDTAVEKANILLVDDRADKLLAIETVLEELGQNIVKATSGMEALRLLLRQDFAVILLDVSMPGLDGFETAALIRQRARSENTPIIFVTSINTTDTHVSRGYSLGAVDYIFSPVEPEILRAKVGVFIDLYRKTEQVRYQSELLRREAEERAANLEVRLHSLLNHLDIGVFRATESGSITEANPAFTRLLGFAVPDDVAGMRLEQFLHPGEREGFRLVSGARDIRFVRQDGREVWVQLTLTVNPERNGQVIEGLAEDVTDRKAREHDLKHLNETLERRVFERTEALRISQEHLRRSERLASLGTLAAGIAHEINNPLNAIVITARYALKNPKFDRDKAFETICNEAMRGGEIVRGILRFAKEEKVTKTPTDLNELIKHTRDLAKTYLGSNRLSVELELAENLPPLMLNSTAIEQVLFNLINNAAEASQGETSVVVRTHSGSEVVRVEVRDNGPGIPEDTLPRIFDPFFSTKRSAGGTGLGLSICHGIILEHGGSITVDSQLGQGTVFSIQLPAASVAQGTMKEAAV